MNEILNLTLSLVMGVLLGAIFFGGLWWTVKKMASSQWPALWIIVSLIIRMSIALTGFYFVGHGHWERLMLCLLGFVLARLVMQLLTRPSGKKQTHSALEARHASQS